MNAQRQDNPKNAPENPMKGALVKSSLFHGLIFLVVLVGLPFAEQEPLIVAPVSVELVDISELTKTNKKPPPKVTPIEKPKPIEPPKPPEEPLKKPEPEVKKPDPVPPPKPKEEPKKEPVKPKEKPKPKKPKEEPKKQEDLFSSLLKDLTPEKDKPEESQEAETPEPEDGSLADVANQISMSELDALRAQLEPCWNIPSGAKFAENLLVKVRVTMNRDMTIRDARIANRGRYNRDPAFRAAADSALRALRNPRCSPLKLPPEKYKQWKTITINFDPSDML